MEIGQSDVESCSIIFDCSLWRSNFAAPGLINTLQFMWAVNQSFDNPGMVCTSLESAVYCDGIAFHICLVNLLQATSAVKGDASPCIKKTVLFAHAL